MERAIQELRGFQRVALRPGERKTVEIPLKTEWLAYWDEGKHAFVVEGGKKIQIRVGASSADIRLTRMLSLNREDR